MASKPAAWPPAVGSYRHSRRRGLDLEAPFSAMDAVVAEQFGTERFVTGQLVLDLQAGLLTWVNAGHPRPLLWRDGAPADDLHFETSLPLGLGYVPSEVAQVSLEPGDAVLFLTDGVLEARSPTGEFFGRDRLAQMWAEVFTGGQPAGRGPSEAVPRHPRSPAWQASRTTPPFSWWSGRGRPRGSFLLWPWR